MANASENQACISFANTFAQILARVLSAARGTDWQIALAEPPSATLPTLLLPAYYRFRFGARLKGACYAAFGETDVAVLAGGAEQAAAAKDADMVADAAALVESPAQALLELMRSLSAALPDALAAAQGTVTALVEQVGTLDPLTVFALELRANNAKGGSVVSLLYFDPALLEALSPAALPAAAGPGSSMVQANLGMVMDVELNCTLRFGQRQLSLREILDLASGSVVELDRQVDEPVELILDGRVIARGEAVIIDGNYGLRVTQVLHAVAF